MLRKKTLYVNVTVLMCLLPFLALSQHKISPTLQEKMNASEKHEKIPILISFENSEGQLTYQSLEELNKLDKNQRQKLVSRQIRERADLIFSNALQLLKQAQRAGQVSGVYIYRIQAGEFIQIRQMILIK